MCFIVTFCTCGSLTSQSFMILFVHSFSTLKLTKKLYSLDKSGTFFKDLILNSSIVHYNTKSISMSKDFLKYTVSVHINESKLIWGNRFVDFLRKYLSYRQSKYQFSYSHSKSFHISISDFYSEQRNS